MFDIGLQEILLIGVLALLVFGPSKLPELGRMVGRAKRELRRASEEFRSTVETNLRLNDPDGLNDPPAPGHASSSSPEEPPSMPVSTMAGEPVPAEQPLTATEVEGPNTEPFCSRRGSLLYHRRDCAWARRIPDSERVYFKQISDARDEGLRTCPVCEPWEPGSPAD